MTFEINDITLYKSGIGFFNGACKSDKFILPVSDDIVDDVLKSLAIEGLKSVTFSAAETKDNIQKKIGINIDTENAFLSFSKHLIGLEIIVDADEPHQGTLVGIDYIIHSHDTEENMGVDVLVLKQNTKITHIPISEIKKIKLIDEALKKDLDVFLNLEAITRKAGVINLEIETEKQNAKIQWVSPVSAWRLSYRVLYYDDSKKSQFIGIAIVDNTTSIDWEDIKLKLVTGKPVSFKYDLHTPLHVDRPWVQRDEQGISPLLSQPAMRSPTSRRDRGLASRITSEEDINETRFKTSKKFTLGDDDSWEISRNVVMDRKTDSTKELGSTVTYQVVKPITINRSESSLIPLFMDEYQSEECIVVREDRIDDAMDALVFSKDLDLEKGVATIYVNEIFAGDSMIVRGSDYIAYRLNQDIKLIREKNYENRISSIEIRDNIMYQKYTNTLTFEFKILNISDQTVPLLLEIPKESSYKPKEETVKETSNYFRYKFNLEPGTTEKSFNFEYTYKESIYIRDIPEETIKQLIKEKILDDRNERIVERIFSNLKKVKQKEKEFERLENEIAFVYKNQERIRENIKTLQEIVQESKRDQYIQRLKDSEKILENLERDKKELSKEIEKLREKI